MKKRDVISCYHSYIKKKKKNQHIKGQGIKLQVITVGLFNRFPILLHTSFDDSYHRLHSHYKHKL